MAILKSTQIKGDLTVTGSLNVQGNLTYVGVENLRVKDHQIELNANDKGSASLAGADQAGIVIRGARTTENVKDDASILYNHADDTLVVNKTIKGTVSNATTAASADKVAKTLTVNVTDESGSLKTVTFDGSAEKTVNVNLQGLQNQINSLTGGTSSVATQISNAISELDVADAAVAGQYVSAVSETDGKISVTRAALPDYKEVYDAKGSAAAVLGKADDDSTVNTVYGVKAYAKKCADDLAASKADTVHQHKISDVTDLQATLDEKAAKTHTHAIADVIGLSDELAGKQNNLSTDQLNAVNSKITAAKVSGYDAHVINTDMHVSTADRDKWDAAEQNAKDYADGKVADLKNTVDSLNNEALKGVAAGKYVSVSAKSDNSQTISVTTQSVATASDTANGLALAADVKKYVTDAAADAVAAVVAGAPSDFDTLKEVADWIKSDTTGAAAIQTDVAGLKTDVAGLKTDVTGLKTDVSTLKSASHTHANMAELNKIEDGDKAKWDGHVNNGDIHVTAEQKAKWDAKQNALANASTLSAITSDQVSGWNNAAAKAHEHTNKTVLDGITAEDVTAWDNAVSARVSSVGGKSGALTLEGGSTKLGDVNLSISDTGKISAAIVPNSFDASGSAATALTNAKSYVDSKVDGKFDAAGAAAAVKSEVIGVSGDAADKDTIYGAKKYADVAVSALSSSVATKDATQDADITKIKSDIANITNGTTLDGRYVNVSGDTMTGDLTMPSNGTNGIVFGGMKIVWKDNAIEFIPTTA